MCLVVLVLRFFLTTVVSWQQLKTITIWLQYSVPVLENALAVIFTLLVLHPQGCHHCFSPILSHTLFLLSFLFCAPSGQLAFNACRLTTITDFYPLFFNPTVDFVNEINCTYEVAYPLYVTLDYLSC